MATMAGNLREEFDQVEQRVIDLHWQWNTYCCLFPETAHHAALFLEADPDAFSTIHWTFVQAICMSLCRLGDSTSLAGNSNLTLERLSGLASSSNLTNAVSIKDLADKFKARTTVFRQIRNKRFAHADLKESFKTRWQLFSKADVEESHQLLRDFMNALRTAMGRCQMGYEHVQSTTPMSSGQGLIFYLRSGLRYQELVHQDQISYDDLQNSKWGERAC
jgi:hypothetical protein